MIDSPLFELLGDLRRRLLVFSGLSASAWGILASLAVFLFGAWGDLVLDFPGWLRIAILFASAGAAVGLLAAGIRRARQLGQTDELARRLDCSAQSQGEILTGIDLAETSATMANPLTQGLARIAVEQATRLAGQVPEQVVIPSKPLKQAFGILGAAAVACWLTALIAPRLVSTEFGRFFDPFGDHPPYTAVEFQVQPGDIQIVYGRGAEIAVQVTGDDVARVDLLLQAEASKPPESLPMFLAPGGTQKNAAEAASGPVWKASVANVTQPMKYHVRSGSARSRVYSLNVITVPKLEAVRFEITPPEYTQRPPYRGALPTNGISGLPGTTVRFWGKSNRHLSGGDAQVTAAQAESLAMIPSSGDPFEVTGSFVVSAPGKLQFSVTDREGQTSEETFTAPITVLKDERPFVRLAQPREISFATPSAVLPVIITAEDDFGVAQVQVYRSLNDSRYSPLEVDVASPPPTRWQSQVLLPLSAYGLSPGDVLKVFARVEDNRPDEPQGAESEIATVRIVAEEDFNRLSRSQEDGVEQLQKKYEQARRRLEQVAHELDALQEQLTEKAANGEEISDEDREKLETLAKRMEQEAEALEELRKKNELPYDLDRELAKELDPLADQLKEMALELRKRSEQQDQTIEQLAQELKEMQEQLQQERREFDENVSEPLELLAGVLDLMKDQARFSELFQQQESLAERLSSLKNRDGEDNPPLQRRMRDLEAEQERVRQELSQLMDDIESHAGQLPEHEELNELREQAQEFCKACKASGATDSMKDAETGLAEFSGSKGHAGARDAKEKLEQLLEKSDEMQAGTGEGMQRSLSFKPSLGQAAGKTLQQLLAEAGLSPGQSPGRGGQQGAGGGRSARRNSMDNVGLYGGQPEDQPRSSMQSQPDHRQQGKFARRFGGDERRPEDGTGGVLQGTQASGRAEAQAPAVYRRRVAAYFERVVDELNE